MFSTLNVLLEIEASI